jgi:DNA-binding GntR family transcriptional regulator
MPEPREPHSSVDRAYREIRDAIVRGDHPPGSPLRHRDLSDRYGVSLIPIREALRRLEVERLVETRQNHGARVAPISAADVRDAYATRILLEAEALRRAWPKLQPEDVAGARRALDRMFEALDQGRLAEAAELHREHHFDLWTHIDSPWLEHLIRILWIHTERYRNLALLLETPTPGPSEYHLGVLDAIDRGDLSAAIERAEAELTKSRDVVISHVEATSGGAESDGA